MILGLAPPDLDFFVHGAPFYSFLCYRLVHDHKRFYMTFTTIHLAVPLKMLTPFSLMVLNSLTHGSVKVKVLNAADSVIDASCKRRITVY